MDRESNEYCLKRRLSSLPHGERELFEDEGLFIMPTWKRTLPITKKYLQKIGNPVARIDCSYEHPTRVNHAKSECNMPQRNALCVGSIVMLLHNYLVELNLKNGSLGRIIKIVYENRDGPRGTSSPQPAYVVVDFPDSQIPTNEAWDQHNPTHIPIPVLKLRCEKNCCTQIQIPLRVCKAITIHKSTGATVGEGYFWRKVVIGMPG
jgi:hypothetical protein